MPYATPTSHNSTTTKPNYGSSHFSLTSSTRDGVLRFHLLLAATGRGGGGAAAAAAASAAVVAA